MHPEACVLLTASWIATFVAMTFLVEGLRYDCPPALGASIAVACDKSAFHDAHSTQQNITLPSRGHP